MASRASNSDSAVSPGRRLECATTRRILSPSKSWSRTTSEFTSPRFAKRACITSDTILRISASAIILLPSKLAPPGRAMCSPAQSSRERRDVERLEAVVIDPAQVRVEKAPQIRQAVFEHRQAVEADAPGEALIDLGIDAAIGQHIGMDHAAAEDFKPILALAEPDLPARTAALDVDLERGRGEGEKARAKPYADMGRLEKGVEEFPQYPLKICERRALVDHQALNLVEHWRVRLVGVTPISAPRANDPDRRLLRQHRAHLHRAGVRAQTFPLARFIGRKKERVVHLARRMSRREVELSEIVVVALDVRPFGDGKAHLGENGGDLVHHLADWMDPSGFDAGQADGQRDVGSLAFELGLKACAFQHRAPRRERFRDLILQRIDGRALGLALVRSELAERGEQRGDRSLLAERSDARGLERAFIRRAFNRGERHPFKA